MYLIEKLIKIDYKKTKISYGVVCQVFESMSLETSGQSDYKKIIDKDFLKKMIEIENEYIYANKELCNITDLIKRKEIMLKYKNLTLVRDEFVDPKGKFSVCPELSYLEEIWDNLKNQDKNFKIISNKDGSLILQNCYSNFLYKINKKEDGYPSLIDFKLSIKKFLTNSKEHMLLADYIEDLSFKLQKSS